jgi:hypothetical protein
LVICPVGSEPAACTGTRPALPPQRARAGDMPLLDIRISLSDRLNCTEAAKDDQTDALYLPVNEGAVENALRPVAVGRTRDLHLGSDCALVDGARASSGGRNPSAVAPA